MFGNKIPIFADIEALGEGAHVPDFRKGVGLVFARVEGVGY